MTTPINTFVTSNHSDFKWPYSRPLMIIPSQPPENTGQRLYLPRPHLDECKCHFHSYENNFTRYRELANQESQLCNDIKKINHEMTELLSKMLNSSCKSDDETMKSVYQVAHTRPDTPLTQYRSFMAKIDSPIESHIKPVIRELKDGYVNPDRFRYSAKEILNITPAESIDFIREPEMFRAWNQPFIGQSEYMDTISKFGTNNLKNRKQYLEPFPSSRRRWSNTNS